MTSRLTTRSDTPTDRLPDRIGDRISATDTACRSKPAKSARTDRKAAPLAARPAPEAGATMAYQLGFASGPGA